MRVCSTIAAGLVLLSGCGDSGAGTQSSATAPTSTEASAARVERCVDRLVSRAPAGGDAELNRRYVRDTYCTRFEERGWIYPDGALSIATQTWLESGGTSLCSGGGTSTPTGTVPCEETSTLDCALLHHVRRAEVTAYLAQRQRRGDVTCDDGTPLTELGVP